MPFNVKPNQSILFIGDSITDCGRTASERPLGDGYVRQIRDLMVAKYPTHEAQITNRGISGNTIRDLTDRWSDDCIALKPNWLSIKIGINDSHCWIRKTPDRSIDPDEFYQLYDNLLKRVKKETQAEIILIDPFYLSTDRHQDSFRSVVLKHLPKYLKVVEAMAARYKTRHVKTHQIFQNLLKHHDPNQFCAEPVHPNLSGHLVIAHAWLKTMGW